MGSSLSLKLKLLDDRQKLKKPLQSKPRGLMVHYGWAKLNKIRKKEAISVIFENDSIPPRSQKFVAKMQDTVYSRLQTPGEEEDAKNHNRSFTEYCIFMHDKNIKGSLEKALQENYKADRNNVAKEVLDEIKSRLKEFYLSNHPNYKEPIIQLEIDFDYDEIN